MKLKREPEDFQVEELPIVQPSATGRQTFYRLTKRGLATFEAIEAIRRRWNLSGRQISYGGLKDKYALTIQYLTITDGPMRSMHEQPFDLEPLGKLPWPYGPAHFRGNRFAIVVRDLGRDHAAGCQARLSSVTGLPNYFDDQRFGSIGNSGRFIAHAWLKCEYEEALRLALAEPNASDRSGVKANKAILRESWGRWAEAKARLERSSERSIVTYLVDHPDDFRGAFARTRRELRTLYFSAFQSHLWNLMLARWIDRNTRPEQRLAIELKLGRFPFPIALEEEQAQAFRSLALCLPSARTPLPAGELGEAAVEVLEPFGLAWTDLRIKHLKDVFFSKGSRPALISPQGLRSDVRPDPDHPGRKSLSLDFELPKGSYATILIKLITTAAGRD